MGFRNYLKELNTNMHKVEASKKAKLEAQVRKQQVKD